LQLFGKRFCLVLPNVFSAEWMSSNISPGESFRVNNT
jgi:hypothetical protein